MNTEIKNIVAATDKKAQYDTSAKRLLGQKRILAHILVNTVEEFKGMNPEEVVSCIVGNPAISVVPVEPGLTNSGKDSGQRQVFFNTEDGEINEGVIRFDIVFYVRMKDGLSQIIVNLEAQKGEPSGYDIIGSYDWKGKLNLLNIIMIGLSENLAEHNEEYELHRLLGALLSQKLTVKEKVKNVLFLECTIMVLQWNR